MSAKVAKHQRSIRWKKDVALVNNPVIQRQFLGIMVISAGLVSVFLLILGILEGDMKQIQFAGKLFLILCGIYLVLGLVLCLLFFGNSMRVSYILDQRGAKSSIIDRQAKWGNRLAIFIGFLTRNPGLAGAGLLARSHSGRSTNWRDVEAVKCDDTRQAILLRGRWLLQDALFCNPENYQIAKKHVLDRTQHVKARSKSVE